MTSLTNLNEDAIDSLCLRVDKQKAEIERLTARIKCDHAILQGAKKAMVQASDEIERLTAELKQANAVVEVVATFDCDCIEMPASQLYEPCLRCKALASLETDDECSH